jgi:predicted nucleic-acid-binding Zn-ribbon protein
MKNGKCPKCNTSTVYKCTRGIDWGSKSQWLEVWTGETDSRTNMWAGFDSYVCSNCGYFETYITDDAAINEIKAKWKKVT